MVSHCVDIDDLFDDVLSIYKLHVETHATVKSSISPGKLQNNLSCVK